MGEEGYAELVAALRGPPRHREAGPLGGRPPAHPAARAPGDGRGRHHRRPAHPGAPQAHHGPRARSQRAGAPGATGAGHARGQGVREEGHPQDAPASRQRPPRSRRRPPPRHRSRAARRDPQPEHLGHPGRLRAGEPRVRPSGGHRHHHRRPVPPHRRPMSRHRLRHRLSPPPPGQAWRPGHRCRAAPAARRQRAGQTGWMPVRVRRPCSPATPRPCPWRTRAPTSCTRAGPTSSAPGASRGWPRSRGCCAGAASPCVVDNDVTRSTFGAWFRRSYPAYDPVAVQRFWDRQGFTTEHLTIAWTFDHRDDLDAVTRIELPPGPADEVLAAHARAHRRLRGGTALEAVLSASPV